MYFYLYFYVLLKYIDCCLIEFYLNIIQYLKYRMSIECLCLLNLISIQCVEELCRSLSELGTAQSVQDLYELLKSNRGSIGSCI